MCELETILLDIRGQICPSTLLASLGKVNQHLEQIKEKRVVLEIRTDSRDATNTIPDATANMGLSASVQKSDGYYRIYVKSGG